MDYFHYREGTLFCEDVPVVELAQRHGTPLYLYSARTIRDHYRKLRQALAQTDEWLQPPLICYSVKANSNLSILKLMADEGSGFDVVSAGELYRARKIGASPDKIVFAGVGKTDEEICYALKEKILLFNVESEEELFTIDRIARELKTSAQVAIRVNPDVDPHTHTFMTTGKRENKFGLDLERTQKLMERHRELKSVRITGVHCHIGSQITSTEPYLEMLRRIADFLPACRRMGLAVEWINIGGGFGIWYKEKLAKPAKEIADAILPLLVTTGCKLILEPGRFVVGNAGILVTRVLYVKDSGDKKFAICDAGMNDLIRPTLYSAYHRIWPVIMAQSYSGEAPDEDAWGGPTIVTDVVGPICESGDFFAKERKLPSLKRGDCLAVFSAGAYGYVMSSNYNSHPRPCEIMVSGDDAKVVTERERLDDLVRNEKVESFPL